jgi:hypothetical protein
MLARIRCRLLLFGLLILPLTAGCAANNARYNAETGGPADSWGGFWSILIAVLALIVGFLVGATVARNGGIRISTHRHHRHRRAQAGWDRIARHIQDGTKQGLAEWRSTGRAEEPDWGDLSRRIEERILEEMRKHHD